jgi:TPR repeat protein
MKKYALIIFILNLFLIKHVYSFVGGSRDKCENLYGKTKYERKVNGEIVVIYSPNNSEFSGANVIVSYKNNISTSTQYRINNLNNFPDLVFSFVLKINSKPNLIFNRCGFSPDKTKEIWSLEDGSVFITKNVDEAIVDVVTRDNIMSHAANLGMKVPPQSNSKEMSIFEIQKGLAETGDAYSQYMLGLTYARGDGVEKDQSEAVKWYLKASEQGLAEAQSLLGSCYELGKGVEKNQVEAVKWYQKAAEQDDALAQYLLGFCYESGNGLEKNQAEAIRLYHEAANKGIPQAQFSLGCCYIDGKGVSRDRVEGYAYLKLASNRLELAQKFLSDLENKLTPEEIAAGQRRTKELQKK